MAELFTGKVLFQNDTICGMLSRINGIIGNFPKHMIENESKLVHNYFTKEYMIYQELNPDDESEINNNVSNKIQIMIPKKSNLKSRLKTNDK